MSWKKFLCGALAASIIFSASTFCSAAEESANAKLSRIEIDTYGTEQSGALLDRIGTLEKSYSGQNMGGNMNARIEAIYDILYNNVAGPGIMATLNALEWNINHEVASGGLDIRLSALEKQIFGKTNEGTFNDRLRALTKESYGDEILPTAQVQIPAKTLIKVVTTAPVSSKTLQEGDSIPIKVVEDVVVEDSLVFAKGLPGEGIVTSVRHAKNIFSNGKIETDFCRLKTIDGQTATTSTDTAALERMDADSMSRGLSLIGQTFSGKSKGVEEVFIRGKNVDLPEGIELYVQIKEPLIVYGVRIKNKSLIPAPTNESTISSPTEEPTIPASTEEESTIPASTEEESTIPALTEEESTIPAPTNKPTAPEPPREETITIAPSTETDSPAVEEKTPEVDDEEIIEIIDED